MVNKKMTAMVIALMMVTGGLIQAGAAGSGGGQQSTVTTCCTGVTAVEGSTSNCTCAVTSLIDNQVSDELAKNFAKLPGAPTRARGDVLTFNLPDGARPKMLNKSGTIQLPQAGKTHLYQYGQIKIVVASYGLADQTKNGAVSPVLKGIINAAAINNPWAKSMVLVARSLPGETTYTEVSETYTDLMNMAQAQFITYQGIDDTTVKFTIRTNRGVVDYIVDFNPINK